MSSEYIESSISQIKGRDLRYTPQFLVMLAPNILHPGKLAANIRHPVHEVLHTNHKQYPVDMQEGVEYHIVEHRLFNKLVTVDIVRQVQLAEGFIPRIKQLFDRSFYYGHAGFFPQPFKLTNRTFVKEGFDQEEHNQRVLLDAYTKSNFYRT